MSLPELPLLGNSDSLNIELIYNWLNDFVDGFANAAGFAIDPTQGSGGDGSLTIVDEPIDITYTPGSSLSVDEVIFGHIDIAFTPPDKAVAVVILYREDGVTNFKSSIAPSSPYRLIGLKIGTSYEVKLAGQAANGSLGPYSDLTEVVIPTTGFTIKAPSDAGYWLGQAHASLVNGIIPSGEMGIISVDPLTGAIGVEVNGIPYGKIQQVVSERLLGRGDSGTGDVQELTVDSNAFVILGTELQNSPDTGWSVTGLGTDRTLANTDTLLQTQAVLGTLITTLITKKVLSA